MHHAVMRSHRDIIQKAGADAVHVALGRRVSIHTVRSWMQRDSIPAEHWRGLINAGLATANEMIDAAAPANNTQAVERAA